MGVAAESIQTSLGLAGGHSGPHELSWSEELHGIENSVVLSRGKWPKPAHDSWVYTCSRMFGPDRTWT